MSFLRNVAVVATVVVVAIVILLNIFLLSFRSNFCRDDVQKHSLPIHFTYGTLCQHLFSL